MRELEIAIQVAQEAGSLLVKRLLVERQVRYKGPADLVTDADRASESLIVERLRRDFPGYGILSEEGKGWQGDGRHQWIVDPLDGTTNYVHGFPFFAVSIALAVEGQVRLGVVYDPLRGELFQAVRGEGGLLNHTPLAVSEVGCLEEALLCTGFPHTAGKVTRENLAYFGEFLLRAQAVRRPGSAALDLAYVAAGRLDGFWELTLSAWDMAAGVLLVEEAGGQVSSPSGEPFNLFHPAVVASNGKIHASMLQVLSRQGG
ncbi:MAG: inositol monophosphatase family protein [Candidatus Methylomirabilales bacterium]